MRSLLILAVMAATLSACASQPYEPLPTSSYQWQQRQERIQREEAARLARCETLKSDRERYARECMRAVETPQ